MVWRFGDSCYLLSASLWYQAINVNWIWKEADSPNLQAKSCWGFWFHLIQLSHHRYYTLVGLTEHTKNDESWSHKFALASGIFWGMKWYTLPDMYLRTGRFSVRYFECFQHVPVKILKWMIITHLKVLKNSYRIRNKNGKSSIHSVTKLVLIKKYHF